MSLVSLAWLSVARITITLAVVLLLKLLRGRGGWGRRLLAGGVTAWVILNLAMVAAEIDTQYIEPFRLTTTTLPLEAPAFLPTARCASSNLPIRTWNAPPAASGNWSSG